LGQFLTIGEALEAAKAGDKVYVLPGTYRESGIRVEKSVELAGQGSEDQDVILESEDDILYLLADGATIRGLSFRTLAARRFSVRANSNCGTISACRFSGPESTGLLVEGGSHLIVEGCSFDNCRLGVRIEDACPAILASKFTANTTGLLVRAGCDCVVENSDFTDNEGASIEIQADTNAKVSRNCFRGGTAGVVVRQTSKGSIEHNDFFGHSERSAVLLPDGVTEAVVRLNHFE
jgi:nitrous oxidase accessory protein NosD